jgi:hypothetical protein
MKGQKTLLPTLHNSNSLEGHKYATMFQQSYERHLSENLFIPELQLLDMIPELLQSLVNRVRASTI